MKATEGTGYVDPMYATNRAGAMAVGIPMAAYHFADPDSTPGEAVAEADHYVAVAGLTAGNLLPALDLEQTGALAPAALQVWVRAWLDEVTAKLGIQPMIYVSPSFWSSKMGNNTSIALAGYKVLWIANWGVTSPTVPGSNWSGNGWTFWQYTDCGHVAGITTGCVDLDRYNGTDLTPVTYNPTFSVVAAPTSQSIMRGGTTTFAISVNRSEFVPPVTLSLTSPLPAGTTASFSPNPVTGSILDAHDHHLERAHRDPAGRCRAQDHGRRRRPDQDDRGQPDRAARPARSADRAGRRRPSTRPPS